MQVIIPNERPLSHNVLYSSLHWSKKAAHTARVQRDMKAILGAVKTITAPVKIIFTVYYGNAKYLDVDNISVKEMIDGLKAARVIPDDTPQYVREVTVRHGGTDRENPRVEIDICEL